MFWETFGEKNLFSLTLGNSHNEIYCFEGSVEVWCPNYALKNYQSTSKIIFVKEGRKKLKVGKESLEILLFPGHAPGASGFLFISLSNQAIVGYHISRKYRSNLTLQGNQSSFYSKK